MNPNPHHPRFRYLADPVCIGSIALYCLNRWLLKPHHWGGAFCHDYLNDFLCLPLLLPIILRIQSLLRIRRHDAPPTLFEILHNWLVFSTLYELILPRFPAFRTTADPWDALAYLAGGLLGYILWNHLPWSAPTRADHSAICPSPAPKSPAGIAGGRRG